VPNPGPPTGSIAPPNGTWAVPRRRRGPHRETVRRTAYTRARIVSLDVCAPREPTRDAVAVAVPVEDPDAAGALPKSARRDHACRTGSPLAGGRARRAVCTGCRRRARTLFPTEARVADEQSSKPSPFRSLEIGDECASRTRCEATPPL
jgi:hypothetical protein